VRFSCATHGAPLTSPCPTAVTLRSSRAGQSVTRTIAATNGGMATVAVTGINIDSGSPQVHIAGVKSGATYTAAVPTARCVSTDRVSGIASCRLSHRVVGTRTAWTAVATDRAGNSRSTTLGFTVLPIYLDGASYSRGAFTVHPVHTYTLVVNGSSARPVYYDAATYPQQPSKPDNAFHPAGHHRWTLGVTMTRSLRTHLLWNVGVKIHGTMHVLKIRIG
jgi:hypothetical protein